MATKTNTRTKKTSTVKPNPKKGQVTDLREVKKTPSFLKRAGVKW